MLLETDVDVWLLRSDGATNASAALQHDIARAERNGKSIFDQYSLERLHGVIN